MRDLRKLVLEGKNHVEHFFSRSLGTTIKLRPLTAWESDQVMLEALSGIKSRKVVDLLININIASIDMQERVDLTPEEFAEFLKYRRLVDYYTCYHAMKDFSDITIEDLFDSTLEIHEMADMVRNMSVANPLEIDEFVTSEDGKLLASLHYVVNVPLTSEAWKLTRLQLNFLNGAYQAYIKPEESKKITREFSSEDLEKNPAEVLRRFFSAKRGSGGEVIAVDRDR